MVTSGVATVDDKLQALDASLWSTTGISLLALMSTILWFYHSSLPNILTAYMCALFTSEYFLYFRAFVIGGN